MTTSNNTPNAAKTHAPKLAEKVESFKAIFSEAARNQEAIKNEAAQKIEVAENDDAKAASKKAMQRAATHEKYNDALSGMSEKALSILAKYKVDPAKLSEQSRELKKRSIKILEALASNSKVDDRALDAVLQFIELKKSDVLTLEVVRRQMDHETTTQAQYFKTCAIFFGFATYSKSEKELTLKKDNNVLADLLKIYDTTPKAVAVAE
jgi:hypothetical protein